jgi:hypothetical protein
VIYIFTRGQFIFVFCGYDSQECYNYGDILICHYRRFPVSHIYEESIQFFIQSGEEWFVAITYRSILRGHSCLTDRLIGKAAKIG